MLKEEIKKLNNIDLVGQLISHAHTFGDFVQETKDFSDEIICRLENFVIASEQRSDLVNGAVADFVNKYGLDCPYCGDNSGQIIHGYSGDSLADLEMCEFCYTTPNSKFNLRNDLEELLKKATASL
jgi:hypothetical protein